MCRKVKESEVTETTDHKVHDTKNFIWVHVKQLPKHLQQSLASRVKWLKVTRTYYMNMVEQPAEQSI